MVHRARLHFIKRDVIAYMRFTSWPDTALNMSSANTVIREAGSSSIHTVKSIVLTLAFPSVGSSKRLDILVSFLALRYPSRWRTVHCNQAVLWRRLGTCFYTA
jgi:hypothetical protein